MATRGRQLETYDVLHQPAAPEEGNELRFVKTCLKIMKHKCLIPAAVNRHIRTILNPLVLGDDSDSCAAKEKKPSTLFPSSCTSVAVWPPTLTWATPKNEKS